MRKPDTVKVSPESLEYAPTAGTKVDRLPCNSNRRNFVPLSPISIITSTVKAKKVNIRLRYPPIFDSWLTQNVCIVPGGRAGLNRLVR